MKLHARHRIYWTMVSVTWWFRSCARQGETGSLSQGPLALMSWAAVGAIVRAPSEGNQLDVVYTIGSCFGRRRRSADGRTPLEEPIQGSQHAQSTSPGR